MLSKLSNAIHIGDPAEPDKKRSPSIWGAEVWVSKTRDGRPCLARKPRKPKISRKRKKSGRLREGGFDCGSMDYSSDNSDSYDSDEVEILPVSISRRRRASSTKRTPTGKLRVNLYDDKDAHGSSSKKSSRGRSRSRSRRMELYFSDTEESETSDQVKVQIPKSILKKTGYTPPSREAIARQTVTADSDESEDSQEEEVQVLVPKMKKKKKKKQSTTPRRSIARQGVTQADLDGTSRHTSMEVLQSDTEDSDDQVIQVPVSILKRRSSTSTPRSREEEFIPLTIIRKKRSGRSRSRSRSRSSPVPRRMFSSHRIINTKGNDTSEVDEEILRPVLHEKKNKKRSKIPPPPPPPLYGHPPQFMTTTAANAAAGMLQPMSHHITGPGSFTHVAASKVNQQTLGPQLAQGIPAFPPQLMAMPPTSVMTTHQQQFPQQYIGTPFNAMPQNPQYAGFPPPPPPPPPHLQPPQMPSVAGIKHIGDGVTTADKENTPKDGSKASSPEAVSPKAGSPKGEITVAPDIRKKYDAIVQSELTSPVKEKDKPKDEQVADVSNKATEYKHFCAGCGQARSKHYHITHPLKKGEIPEPEYCRRCVKNAPQTESESDGSNVRSPKSKTKSKSTSKSKSKTKSTETPTKFPSTDEERLIASGVYTYDDHRDRYTHHGKGRRVGGTMPKENNSGTRSGEKTNPLTSPEMSVSRASSPNIGLKVYSKSSGSSGARSRDKSKTTPAHSEASSRKLFSPIWKKPFQSSSRSRNGSDLGSKTSSRASVKTGLEVSPNKSLKTRHQEEEDDWHREYKPSSETSSHGGKKDDGRHEYKKPYVHNEASDVSQRRPLVLQDQPQQTDEIPSWFDTEIRGNSQHYSHTSSPNHEYRSSPRHECTYKPTWEPDYEGHHDGSYEDRHDGSGWGAHEHNYTNMDDGTGAYASWGFPPQFQNEDRPSPRFEHGNVPDLGEPTSHDSVPVTPVDPFFPDSHQPQIFEASWDYPYETHQAHMENMAEKLAEDDFMRAGKRSGVFDDSWASATWTFPTMSSNFVRSSLISSISIESCESNEDRYDGNHHYEMETADGSGAKDNESVEEKKVKKLEFSSSKERDQKQSDPDGDSSCQALTVHRLDFKDDMKKPRSTGTKPSVPSVYNNNNNKKKDASIESTASNISGSSAEYFLRPDSASSMAAHSGHSGNSASTNATTTRSQDHVQTSEATSDNRRAPRRRVPRAGISR